LASGNIFCQTPISAGCIANISKNSIFFRPTPVVLLCPRAFAQFHPKPLDTGPAVNLEYVLQTESGISHIVVARAKAS
jgi:hypothetical protein